MSALDRFGVGEGAGEVVVGAVVVEGLLLGPQPLDHRAGLSEARHGVRGVAEGQAVGLVLAPGQGVVGAGADTDTEVEPAAIPKSSPPPETTSTVVAILASIAGGRKRLLVVRGLSPGPQGQSVLVLLRGQVGARGGESGMRLADRAGPRRG